MPINNTLRAALLLRAPFPGVKIMMQFDDNDPAKDCERPCPSRISRPDCELCSARKIKTNIADSAFERCQREINRLNLI